MPFALVVVIKKSLHKLPNVLEKAGITPLVSTLLRSLYDTPQRIWQPQVEFR